MVKILLVEDDTALIEIYKLRLEAEGYQIVTANDGQEALTVVAAEKPDLIISDVMMPNVSGFDMLKVLKSTPETARIPVIMMTALSSEEQRERGESLGADRYLVKSQVGIEDMVEMVKDVLVSQAHGMPAPVASAPVVPEPVATTAEAIAAPVVEDTAGEAATETVATPTPSEQTSEASAPVSTGGFDFNAGK